MRKNFWSLTSIFIMVGLLFGTFACKTSTLSTAPLTTTETQVTSPTTTTQVATITTAATSPTSGAPTTTTTTSPTISTTISTTSTPMKPIELKFTNYATETHDTSTAFKFFMEEVNKRTEGLVTFKTYYGGTLGGAKEVLPFAKSRVVDIACMFPAYYPAEFKLTTIAAVPYVGYQMDARQNATIQIIKEMPEIGAEFKAQNVKVLFPAMGSSITLVTKNRIEKAEDLKGMKIRGTGYALVTLSAWGATPVAIEAGEIYEALQRGVINAAWDMPPQSFVTWGIQEVGKFMIETGYGPTGPLYIVMNIDSYNNLPTGIQKIFDAVGNEAANKYAEIRMAASRAVIPRIVNAGVEIYALSTEVQAQLKALAKLPVHERWVQDMKVAGIAEESARKVLARFQELYKQYEPKSTYKEYVEIYKELKK